LDLLQYVSYCYSIGFVQTNLFLRIQLEGYPTMKQLVRAFVAVLVITGAVASTQISYASSQNKVAAARVSCLPIPSCPPNDPDACGLGSTR
jgi:hypothetical protein